MGTKVRVGIAKLWLILVTAGVIVVLDQWTKELVRQSIPKFRSTVPIPALGEYFLFEHVDNYGAAFGILQNGGFIFPIIAAVVSLVILYYGLVHLPADQQFIRFLLGLQMGGALGNVIDRLAQGYVTDFIKVGIPGTYYWPNFNIADSAIVCGVIGLAILIFRQDLERARSEKESMETAVPALDTSTSSHSES